MKNRVNFSFDLTKIKKVIKANADRDEKGGDLTKLKVYTVRFMAVVCLALTAMNMAKHYQLMTISTATMAAGFAVTAFLFEKKGAIKAGNIIIAVMISAMFSMYAIMGNNEGFAILWILLVPAVASNIINLRLSFAICVYFQLLLITMFYSPLRSNFAEFYTQTFMSRYPVLYLASFLVAYIMVVEKEYYSMMVEDMARMDALTQMSNRRHFEELVKDIDLNWEDIDHIRAFSMDLNGLKQANDTIGHKAGDELIMGAADCIRSAFEDAEVISRIGGDEFAVISKQPEDVIDKQMKQLSDNIRMWRGHLVQRLSLSLGSASKDENPGMSIYDLMNLADQKMYEEKRRYYEINGNDRRHRRATDIKESDE